MMSCRARRSIRYVPLLPQHLLMLAVQLDEETRCRLASVVQLMDRTKMSREALRELAKI